MQFHNPSRAEFTKQRLHEVSRGTMLRQLHNGVFDAIERGRRSGGTIFLGRGSRTYDLIGRWVPEGIIGWMMNTAKDPVFEGKRIEPQEGRRGSAQSSDRSVEWEKIGEVVMWHGKT